jgi:hypothetical protein
MPRPGSRPARPTLLLSLAAATLWVCVAAASAEPPKIYKWVDQNGIAHYTTDPDRIPETLRDRILSTGRVAEPEPAPAPPPPRETTTEHAPTTPPSETAATPAPPTPPSETAATPAPPTPPSETTATPVPPTPPSETAATPAPPTPPTPPSETAAAPPPAPAGEPAAAPTGGPAPAPREAIPVPVPETARSDEAWFERDAQRRVDTAAILATGEATPEQLEALAAEQQALDAQIAEIEAAIRSDESFLKGLISDPDLDSDVPLFDRPEFLEVSRRLPELQARLQELRDERAKLELP